MNIAILINNNISYDAFKQANDAFDIFLYQNLADIDFSQFKSYDYIVILNLLCIIDAKALINLLELEKPTYASLSSYWGVGSSNLAIIHNSLFTGFKYSNKIKSLISVNDCVLCELFIKAINFEYKSINALIKLTNKHKQFLLKKYNLLILNKKLYSPNLRIARGQYHNSIFVNISNDIEYFLNTIKEYKSKQKKIYFNNRIYPTFLGVNFFIIYNKHIVLLGKNNFIIWSHNSQSWIPIKSKSCISKINRYLLEHAPGPCKMFSVDL